MISGYMFFIIILIRLRFMRNYDRDNNTYKKIGPHLYVAEIYLENSGKLSMFCHRRKFKKRILKFPNILVCIL